MEMLSVYDALKDQKYYMTLTAYKYSRPVTYQKNEASDEEIQRIIKLPLPEDIRNEISVRYDESDKLSPIVENLQQGTESGTELAKTIGATFASSFVTNVLGETFTRSVAQFAGLTEVKPSTVLLNSTELRSFPLKWNILAVNEKESNRIREMINYLRASSMPSKASKRVYNALKYPNLFQINFYPWDNNGNGRWGWSDKSIIKFKRCFITNVSESYSTGNSNTFFNSGNNEPVSIELSLTFKEIEYFLADDYGGQQTFVEDDVSNYIDYLKSADGSQILNGILNNFGMGGGVTDN